MMTEEQKIYFETLKSALWGMPCPMPEDLDKLLNLSRYEGTGTMTMSALLSESPISDQRTRKELKQKVFSNYPRHQMMNAAVAEVFGALENEGIPAVLLKGQGIASCYPTPEFRECGDIDVFVGDGEVFSRACSVIDNLPGSDPLHASRDMKHYEIKVGSILVEIHRICARVIGKKESVFFKQFSSDGLSKNLVPLKIQDVIVNTPEDTFNAFYIFYHFWYHFMTGGVGFRQICDWTMFLHSRHGKLDEPRLHESIEKMGLLQQWGVFGIIATDYLGLPKEEMPFLAENSQLSQKAERVVRLIFKEGNFGILTQLNRKGSKNYLLHKITSFKYMTSRFFTIMYIFPAAAIKYYFNILGRGVRKVKKDLQNS